MNKYWEEGQEMTIELDKRGGISQFQIEHGYHQPPPQVDSLLLKVAYKIQDSPFMNGIHNWSWVKWVASLSLRVAQGLGDWLCKGNMPKEYEKHE